MTTNEVSINSIAIYCMAETRATNNSPHDAITQVMHFLHVPLSQYNEVHKAVWDRLNNLYAPRTYPVCNVSGNVGGVLGKVSTIIAKNLYKNIEGIKTGRIPAKEPVQSNSPKEVGRVAPYDEVISLRDKCILGYAQDGIDPYDTLNNVSPKPDSNLSKFGMRSTHKRVWRMLDNKAGLYNYAPKPYPDTPYTLKEDTTMNDQEENNTKTPKTKDKVEEEIIPKPYLRVAFVPEFPFPFGGLPNCRKIMTPTGLVYDFDYYSQGAPGYWVRTQGEGKVLSLVHKGDEESTLEIPPQHIFCIMERTK